MIPTELAIHRLRRDLALSSLMQNALILAAVIGFALSVLPLGLSMGGNLLLVIIAGLWLTLTYRSAQGSRVASHSPSLIAAGQYEQAERQIESALSSFSLFRTVKLQSLHYLAVLRHAQRRWHESATLSRAVLRQRLVGSLKGVSRQSRLILADALLEMGDVRGAYEAISGLYAERLSLGEAMNLLAVQLDYLSRTGAWTEMMRGITQKVAMLETMPTSRSARAQALLALAAKKIGRDDWSQWLRKRVELLVDPKELATERPVLWELWEKPPLSS